MTNANESIHALLDSDGNGCFKGLTKREYFAAMAMQGLLAADAKYQGKTNNYPLLAVDAIAHADALIKALNEPPCKE